MTELEVVARTEAEAVQEASAELDIPSSSLEVIEEYDPDDQDVQDFARKHSLAAAPPASDLGVFVIRVSFKHYQEEAQEWTQGLIERFAPGSKAEAIGFRHIIIVRLSVPDPSILIGKNGATLDALQHVVVRALLTIDEKFPDVMLDVERYREKKLIRLEKEARGAADRALRSGRSVALSPMSPAERKFIHNVVKEIDGVKSESRGVEKGRHIVIEPTNPRPQQSRGGPRPGGGGKPYHKDGNRGGGGGGGNRGGGYQGNRPQGGGGGQQGNRQGGQGGGNKGPITEEQRQLLYGKKMAKMESCEDAPIEEKRSFMDYRGGHDAGPAAGGPNKLQDELE